MRRESPSCRQTALGVHCTAREEGTHAAVPTGAGVSTLLCVLVCGSVIVLRTLLAALVLPGHPTEVVLVPRGVVLICAQTGETQELRCAAARQSR
jgi:hypothetical protein